MTLRVREMPRLEELLAKDFPSVSLIARDPQPGEDVPVSLGNSKLFAPAQFLTVMFGLPDYFGFDPSPYIFLTFLTFFGLCFGDVIYGLALFGLCRWLAWKARPFPSLARLFRLLAWGGAVSIVIGVLTGSWAADLLSEKYLGPGNPISAVPAKFAIFNPMDKPVVGLGIALALGVLNQFFAMALLIRRGVVRGSLLSGLADGALWLIFLPALMVLLGSSALDWPPIVGRVALWATIAAAVALVLTQGRNEKTFLAKALTGVVSLYGIVGTYGTTSFVGDILSYSRLLALGLTTVVVGQSINMIGGLFSSAPYVGIIIFVAFIVCFHACNILISTLGAFVHSARLIFVEFFTKFYEGGARAFVPLGTPQTVRITDER